MQHNCVPTLPEKPRILLAEMFALVKYKHLLLEGSPTSCIVIMLWWTAINCVTGFSAQFIASEELNALHDYFIRYGEASLFF